MSSEPSFFRAHTPDGRQTIDVHVTDLGNGIPEFHCRVILDGNWKNPLEEMKTSDQTKMGRWAYMHMQEMMRRCSK